MNRLLHFGWLPIAVLFFAALSTEVGAAQAITNLSLRGLTIGQPVTLTLDGSDLSEDTRVVLPVSIAAQTMKPGAKPHCGMNAVLASRARSLIALVAPTSSVRSK